MGDGKDARSLAREKEVLWFTRGSGLTFRLKSGLQRCVRRLLRMRRDVVLLWVIVVWVTFPLSVMVGAIFAVVVILTCVARFHIIGGVSITTLRSAMVFDMFAVTENGMFVLRCRIHGGKR